MKKPLERTSGVEVGVAAHAVLLDRRVGQFFDAAGVAAAGEIGGEEGVDAGLGHVAAGQPRAHRDDIGVVVLAGERGGKRIATPARSAQAGLRLTAIEMPMPEPHSATPRSALPAATTAASL